MMGPLSALQRYVAIGLGVALLVAIAWGVRVDSLRAGYKATLGRITQSIELATGRKVKPDAAPVTIEALGIQRDRYRLARDEARGAIARQTASIRTLESKTAELTQISARNRELAAATIRQRDVWIQRAQAAETRTERLSAEAELEECNAVLDALYHDGF